MNMANAQGMETLKNRLTELLNGERGRKWGKGIAHLAAGFFLSAGALSRTFQPLALGVLCAAPPGWGAVLLAFGAAVGYPIFWGTPGFQGTVWIVLGLPVCLLLGNRGIVKRQRTLLPALTALIVSGTGVLFQIRFGDATTVAAYLLRITAGVGAAALVSIWRTERSPWTDWGMQAMGVLALAQVWPTRYLGLGFAAAGYLCASGSFPGAVLAGLALDLARVTPVKMTAVLSVGFALSRIRALPRWAPLLSGALAFVPVSALSGVWDVKPLPGLILGGALAGLFPELIPGKGKQPRTGEAAAAQVRLEQMALALRQMEQALLTLPQTRPDGEAVLARSCEAACDTCPERRGCKGRTAALSVALLEQPGLSGEDLPSQCRKPQRLLSELRRGQEQLRHLKGERNRLEGYRAASREQFGFLADFLEGLADDLALRHEYREEKFRPEIGVSSRSQDRVSGDKCLWFPGPGQRYYVLICDGMGTGPEAAREGEEASRLLKQMLTAGFPAEYALRSLNSLAVLREFGGCTTVDLLQLQLDTGKGTLYKWGASPSFLMTAGQLRRIGTAGPPPGLSHRCREMADRLSLSRGETLILLSDGVSEEALLHSARTTPSQPPGELAAAILEQGASGGDDATAAVIRLLPCRSSAS